MPEVVQLGSSRGDPESHVCLTVKPLALLSLYNTPHPPGHLYKQGVAKQANGCENTRKLFSLEITHSTFLSWGIVQQVYF